MRNADGRATTEGFGNVVGYLARVAYSRYLGDAEWASASIGPSGRLLRDALSVPDMREQVLSQFPPVVNAVERALQQMDDDEIEGYVRGLSDAARQAGGWGLFGAADAVRWHRAAATDAERLLLLSAVQAKYDCGFWHSELAFEEREIWTAAGLSWPAARQPPAAGAVLLTDLQVGEERIVARLSPWWDSNLIIVRRDGARSYLGMIDTSARSQRPDLPREREIPARAESLHDLFVEIGPEIPHPPSWVDPQFAAYLPRPLPTLPTPPEWPSVAAPRVDSATGTASKIASVSGSRVFASSSRTSGSGANAVPDVAAMIGQADRATRPRRRSEAIVPEPAGRDDSAPDAPAATSDASCPACHAEVAPAAVQCPDCGLALDADEPPPGSWLVGVEDRGGSPTRARPGSAGERTGCPCGNGPLTIDHMDDHVIDLHTTRGIPALTYDCPICGVVDGELWHDNDKGRVGVPAGLWTHLTMVHRLSGTP